MHRAAVRLALKIAFALTLAFTLILLARGYVRASRRLNETEISARSDQELLAGTLALSIARAWRLDGRGAAEYVLQYAQQFHKKRSLRLVRIDGHGLSTERPLIDVRNIDFSSQNRADSRILTQASSHRTLVTYSSLGLLDDQVAYALEFTMPIPHRRSLLIKALGEELLVVGLFAAVSAFMLLVFGGWIIGRPINRLVEHTARLGEGDLQSRVYIDRRDELGDLATSMNRLAERLADARKKVEAETEARIAALEQLRHSERLATVGKLAAGVAHEIGTPLTVIRGRAAMITESVDCSSEDRTQGRIIVEQVDRIATIVRGLLDFARTGKNDSTHQPAVDVRRLVQDTANLLAIAARKARVTFHLSVPSQPLLVDMDRNGMQQVLTNLVMNAIQASTQGEIRIGCSLNPTEDAVLLWVEDEGCGISPEIRNRLFEPFFTTKDVGEGTGLGLAVAHGIVREHKGTIEVDTEPGKGSRFSITLPRSSALTS